MGPSLQKKRQIAFRTKYVFQGHNNSNDETLTVGSKYLMFSREKDNVAIGVVYKCITLDR